MWLTYLINICSMEHAESGYGDAFLEGTRRDMQKYINVYTFFF